MELNDLFDYGYKIFQNEKYFKFSIDSVLLSEFIKYKKGYKIIDLCSGNCPIPLILTAKYGNIPIDAIEVQKEIYELGKKSIVYNNLNNINLICDNILNSNKIYKSNSFDIVTSNPPYFEYVSNKNISKCDIKSIARHEILLKLEDFIKISAYLLKNDGILYFSHIPYRLVEITELLHKYNFGLKKIVPVYGKNTNEASFLLFECIKNAKSYVKILPGINIKDYNTYQNIFKEGT